MSRTPMKLILTNEVTGLGGPGDVVEVAGGYGRNYLVPRGLAMRWTRGAEKQIELIKRARAARDIRGLDDARETAQRLSALTVQLRVRAGAQGRLFGSVSASDIAEAVRAAGGPELDRRRIEVTTPIRTIGSHQVTVRLHPEVTATLDVEVSAS
jgi:large subunit ribosomal protein L9